MAILKLILSLEDRTTTGLNQAKSRTDALGRSVSDLGAKLQGLAITGFGIKAAQEFAKLDTGVREIGTLMGDLTEGEIANFRREITDASLEFGESIETLTKARYDIVSAGFSDAAESAILLEQSAKLAAAGVTEVSRTADVLTTVLNAYGKSVEEVEDVSDVLFTTVRLGKTTVDQLSGALGQVLAVAPTVGVSFREVSASLATLTAIGQSTDIAATALSATLTQLLAPSTLLQQRLEELGYTSGLAAIEAEGFAGALQMISAGKTATEIQEMFQNVRAVRAVLPLVGTAAEKFQDNLDSMGSTANATGSAFEQMGESVGKRLDILRQQFRVLLATVGEVLLPLIDAIAAVGAAFTSLPPQLQQTVVVMGALTIAGRALAPVLSARLVSAVVGLTQALFVFNSQAAAQAVASFTGMRATAAGAVQPIARLINVLSTAAGGAFGLGIAAATVVVGGVAFIKTILDSADATREFREELERINPEQANEALQSLEAQLEKLSQKRDKLGEQLRDELRIQVAEGVDIGEAILPSQERFDDLNERIELVQEKLSLLEASGLITDLEEAAQKAEDLKVVISDEDLMAKTRKGLEETSAALNSIQAKLEEARGFRGTPAAELYNIPDLLQQQRQLEARATRYRAILAQTKEPASEVAEEIERAEKATRRLADIKLLAGVELDAGDLTESLQAAVDNVEAERVGLAIKAQIELDTEGFLSEEVKTELADLEERARSLEQQLEQAKEAAQGRLFDPDLTIEAFNEIEDGLEGLTFDNYDDLRRKLESLGSDIEIDFGTANVTAAINQFLADFEASMERAKEIEAQASGEAAVAYTQNIQQRLDALKEFNKEREIASMTQRERQTLELQEEFNRQFQRFATITEIERQIAATKEELRIAENESEAAKFEEQLAILEESLEARRELEAQYREEKSELDQEAYEEELDRQRNLVKQTDAGYAIITSGFRGMLGSISRGASSMEDVLSAVWDSALRAGLGFLTRIVEEYIATQIAMKAIQATGSAAAIAQSRITSSAIAATMAPTAGLVAIATGGGAAISGQQAILATVALTRSIAATAQEGVIVGDGPDDRPIEGTEQVVAFRRKGPDVYPYMLARGEAVIPSGAVDQYPATVSALIEGDLNRTDVTQELLHSAPMFASAVLNRMEPTFNGQGVSVGEIPAAYAFAGDVVSSNVVTSTNAFGGAVVGRSITSATYAQGGTVVSTTVNQTPRLSGLSQAQVVDRQVNNAQQVANDNRTITVPITIQTLDPEAAAEAINAVVQSSTFADAFREAVNDRRIQIQIERKTARVP